MPRQQEVRAIRAALDERKYAADPVWWSAEFAWAWLQVTRCLRGDKPSLHLLGGYEDLWTVVVYCEESEEPAVRRWLSSIGLQTLDASTIEVDLCTSSAAVLPRTR